MTGAKTYKQTRNERLATLKKVWSYLKEYRFRIALTLTFATLATLATLYIPLIIGRAIDCIVGPGQVDFVELLAAVEIMGCAAFVAFAQYFMTLNVNRIACGLLETFASTRLRKIEELPLSYLDARQYGETTVGHGRGRFYRRTAARVFAAFYRRRFDRRRFVLYDEYQRSDRAGRRGSHAGVPSRRGLYFKEIVRLL